MSQVKIIPKGALVRIADAGDYYHGKFARVRHINPVEASVVIFKEGESGELFNGVFQYTHSQLQQVESTVMSASSSPPMT